ncbi:MAG: hypothetical protein AWU57_4952, partial [Marinobacter sp. T13-3]
MSDSQNNQPGLDPEVTEKLEQQ